MEKGLKVLLSSISKVMEDYVQLSDLQKEALNKGKRGDYHAYRLRKTYLNKKLFFLQQQLKSKIHGTYTIVRFSLFNGSTKKYFEQSFTNLSTDEIRDLIALEASMQLCEHEILGIKEIKTRVRDIGNREN